MTSKRTMAMVKELTSRCGEIMAKEVILAEPDTETIREVVERLTGIDRELRRICMEAGVPVIELLSDAGPHDDGFSAGHYFVVTRRSNTEVAKVRAWRARRHESEVEVELEDGSVVLWHDWDQDMELVVADDAASRPACDG